MNIPEILQKIFHYATLPQAAGLLCVLVFMSGKRKRGYLLFLSLSLAVSTGMLLKEFFKVPRPWWGHIENAPYLAESGYALPCLHTLLTAAVLCAFSLTSRKKAIRFLCAAGIWLTAILRVLSGLQSIADVLSGLAAGLAIAVLTVRFGNSTLKKTRCSAAALILIAGLAAALITGNGWGAGTCLTAIFLGSLEPVFLKADPGRTVFGKIYGTVFAAGLYIGLTVLLPFLVEWLITPLWPGQTLTVLLITAIPCLLKLFPLF
ncbi:MAG: phosphatase PAP2 family protein [Anaerolineaceae bacterium]|nr:phosphatase PAP2 family protein [Anaerolineaceae bacterium]